MAARDVPISFAVNDREARVIREVARREGHDAVSPFVRQIVLRAVLDRVPELVDDDDPDDASEAA